MSNTPSNRYPYQHPDPKTDLGFRLLFNSSADLNQAIVTLKSQIEANKADITNVTRAVTTTVTNTPATGGSFPVNVQQQIADYTLQQTDVLGLNVFTGTGPYALELNTGVVRPFLTAILNLSSGVITATPTSGFGSTVNNLASVPINPNCWGWFFWDGVLWWAQIVSVTPNFADAEIPTGAIDGLNTTFVFANAPSPAASLVFVINGSIQLAPANFTISGATVTTAIAPPSGSNIAGWYRY